MVLGGGFLVVVGVLFLASSGDPWLGSAFAFWGVVFLLIGLPLMGIGGRWWYRQLRRSEPLPLVSTDRPQTAAARIEEAKSAFEAGDFGKALSSLWDEVYEASRRRDSEQLEAVKTLANQIERRSRSPADKRTRTKAARVVETADVALAKLAPPVKSEISQT